MDRLLGILLVAIHDGYLWASNTTAVYRRPIPKDGELVPEGEPEIVVTGFPEQILKYPA